VPSPHINQFKPAPGMHEIFAGRDQRRLRFLDVGCGTGRFLDFLKPRTYR
jgi:SAM-dependent methyltransferase